MIKLGGHSSNLSDNRLPADLHADAVVRGAASDVLSSRPGKISSMDGVTVIALICGLVVGLLLGSLAGGASSGGGLEDIIGSLTGGSSGAQAGGMGGLLGSLLPALGGMLAGGGLQQVLSGFQANRNPNLRLFFEREKASPSTLQNRLLLLWGGRCQRGGRKWKRH